MAVAMLYPEPAKGGRGKNSKLSFEFTGQYISQARTILKWTPPMAVAMLYPEPAKRGGKPDRGKQSSKMEDWPRHISQARTILKWTPPVAVAMLYPEPGKGGRGKKNSLEVKEFSVGVSQARTVLKWTPPARRGAPEALGAAIARWADLRSGSARRRPIGLERPGARGFSRPATPARKRSRGFAAGEMRRGGVADVPLTCRPLNESGPRPVRRPAGSPEPENR